MHAILKKKKKNKGGRPRKASVLAPADPHPRPASPPPHVWGTEAAADQKRGRRGAKD